MISSLLPRIGASAKAAGKTTLIAGVLTLFQACTLIVPVETPTPSTRSYETPDATETTEMQLANSLGEGHSVSQGPFKIELTNEGSPLEGLAFVSSALAKELNARGLNVVFTDDAPTKIILKDFSILHHRSNGYSPMVTISTLKADLQTEAGTERIAAMVKRGKVPVWSMSEINDPCFSEPAELLIKELVAKINQAYFDYSLTDSAIDSLVAKIDAETETNKLAYFDVYELGFSNNPNAIEPLQAYSKSDAEYIRLAAISSLGTLGVTDSFEDLKAVYASAKLWQDRGMALKAIGDLKTEEAMAFLKAERPRWNDDGDKESRWNALIIDLYLD